MTEMTPESNHALTPEVTITTEVKNITAAVDQNTVAIRIDPQMVNIKTHMPSMPLANQLLNLLDWSAIIGKPSVPAEQIDAAVADYQNQTDYVAVIDAVFQENY